MQISQEGQLHTKYNQHTVLELCVMLFLYASPIINIILFVFNRTSTSGQLAIVYIAVASGALILCIRYGKRRIPLNAIYLLILMCAVTVSFLYTQGRFGRGNAQFISEFRAFMAMDVCILLLTLNICWSKMDTINNKKLMIFDIILTLVSFLALIRGNGLTTGGLISDTSGFLYQNISYYSAYALGITVYLLYENKDNNKTKTVGVLSVLLIMVQLFTCIMSGGRGGAILAVVLLMYGVISIYGMRRSYKIVLPVTILLLAAIFLFPNIVSVLGVNTRGLNRAINMFNRNDLSTHGRIVLIQNAMSAFENKPFFGNGVGSVFYLMGNYSHNMFVDILTETGVIGLGMVILVLVNYAKKMKTLFYRGSIFRFLQIVFICGITLNLFSGYVWVNQHVWLPVAIVMLEPKTEDDVS